MGTNRHSNAPPAQRATVAAQRRLPEVTASERDFWRRAVAEERSRLQLADLAGQARARPDAN